jgi:hypothetical protein
MMTNQTLQCLLGGVGEGGRLDDFSDLDDIFTHKWRVGFVGLKTFMLCGAANCKVVYTNYQ